MKSLIYFLLLVTAFWGTAQSASSNTICRVTNVADGDTIRAECRGKQVRIRLYCIDAPESSQRPWGDRSTAHLRRITPRTIRLKQHNTDRYGRVIGEIFNVNTSINLAMIEAGQAAVYRQYCSESRYFAAERRAQKARLGIWFQPGDHQRPWEHRRRRR